MYAENDSGSNQGANLKLDPDAETFSLTGTGGQTALSINDSGIVDVGVGATFGNNIHAKFGNSNQLDIYSDNNASFIHETGSSHLYIRGSMIILKSQADNDDYIKCTENGDVKLFYSNVEKLATTNTGVDITGSVQSSTGTFQLDTNDKIAITASNIGFHLDGAEDMRLENDGDLHVEGDVIAYSTTISDERLKHDIEPIEDALSKVNTLRGCTFTYTPDGKKSAGLIAQDVEKVLPSAVSESTLPLKIDDGKEYKVLQYDQAIGLLVEAIKELTAKVEELENK